uniref:Uncharacterized protein n=1 Tax=Strigamia maritima TaxID=126957 RepID=T1JK54_STRMM
MKTSREWWQARDNYLTHSVSSAFQMSTRKQTKRIFSCNNRFAKNIVFRIIKYKYLKKKLYKIKKHIFIFIIL